MREQVVAQKTSNRRGVAAKNRSGPRAQRPVPRDRARSGASLKAILAYVPIVLKVVIAVLVGGLIFASYRAAASASFFQLREVEVQGNSRASSEDVQKTVRREVGKTGVWKTDLNELSTRLERLPWIRTATVSRVLPDGIRVRISEREPRAVVRTASGRFFWADDDAVLLGEMQPTDQLPTFFLRGWNEEESESARKENAERITKFLELQQAWDAAGLSERVSEVNLVDTRDVRAQLAGDDSQIEVRLGSQNLGKRLKDALKALDEQRETSRGPYISYIDLTQGKWAIIGLLSGAHVVVGSGEASTRSSVSKTGVLASTSKPENNQPTARSKSVAEDKIKKNRKAEANRNEKNKGDRPRRVRQN
jgi:cell division protein FtsQ